MVTSILALITRIPKQWLFYALAGLVIYYVGVSHGRAPYKTVQKVFDAQQVLVARHTKDDIRIIYQKGKAVNENITSDVCIIDGDLANRMRVNTNRATKTKN